MTLEERTHIALKRMDAIVTAEKIHDMERTARPLGPWSSINNRVARSLDLHPSMASRIRRQYSQWEWNGFKNPLEALMPRYANCGRKRKAAKRG